MKTYQGIEIENLDKNVSMAHSRFFGKNEGIDQMQTLLNRDKQAMTPEQFKAVSALNSVLNANYQICNGGINQLFFNGYHEYRKPFNEQDVAQLDKDAQVKMLDELLRFGITVFPNRADDNVALSKIIRLYDEAYYEEPSYDWEDEDYDEYDDGVCAPYDFDERYYEVNEYIEILIEAYAQYLNKKLDLEASA